MKEYNGHRSWNQWNASLWLNNGEMLEYQMRAYRAEHLSNNSIFNRLKTLVGTKTHDGGVINALALRIFIREYE